MTRYGLVCLLFGAMAWGQSANSMSTAAQKPGSPSAAAPASTAPKEPEASTVPPNAAVITIDGACANAAEDKSKSPNCKTVITREQFEKIVDSVQPQMPARARRQFANRYANALVMSDSANAMGLEKTPEFEERMQLMRIQVLAQMLSQAEQKKASEIPEQEIADYYKKEMPNYEEADLLRIFIPRVQQPPQNAKDADKQSEADREKHEQESEQVMKKEADTLHQEAVEGKDFDQLQAEAFKVAGIQSKAPTAKMDKVRRNHLPPSQAVALDLKPGEVSAVLSDQSGYFIFKLVDKETLPLDKVSDEIKGTLRSKKLQEEMESIEHSATTKLDEAYFGPEPPRPTAPAPKQPGLR